MGLTFNVQPVRAEPKTWTVNDDGPADFHTIQEAVNSPQVMDGDSIYVYNGTYYENVVMNKSVSLIGENKDFTIIDANGTGNVLVAQADYITVDGFTIQNGGFGVALMGNSTKRYVGNAVTGNIFRNNADAIGLSTCDRNILANNTFQNNVANIIVGWLNPFVSWDVTSNYNTITGNNMTQGVVGITILYSKHNIVSENTISNMTDKGITFLSGGGYPFVPIVTNNSLCNDVIVNCTSGLILDAGVGSCNNITGNVIQHNEMGLCIDQSNNTIMDNTIANNVFGMYLTSKNNLLRANVMFENVYNLVEITYMPYNPPPYNDIDTSNIVNGKPIYYLFNQTNLNINPSTYPDMGFLALKNCSNVIIENMAFSNNGFGISLDECANVTIEKTTIQDNFVAISALSSVDIKIRDSIVQNNLHGLSLIAVDPYSEISNNLIVNNTIRHLLKIVTPYFMQVMPDSMKWVIDYYIRISGGIHIYGMSNSTVIDNVISNNERGIYLEISIYNIFKNNTTTNNLYNFGQSLILIPRKWVINPPDPPQISPHLMNDVDASNTVDGKSIYWWINRQDEQVPNNAGYVVLANCTNMVLKDLILQNNTQGMLLVGVSNSLISNNTIKDTGIGICIYPHLYVKPSTNNTITKNNITRTGVGIRVISPFSIVSNNLLTNNLAGMYIDDNLTVTENTVANNTNPPLNEWLLGYPLHAYEWGVEWGYYGNGVGIKLEGSNITVHSNTIQNNYYGTSVGYLTRKGDNKIYSNNFANNTEQVWRGFPGQPPTPMPNNTWNDDYPLGGNYWSDYANVDEKSGPDQNQLGSDGIGDTPLTIDANNCDHYPFMAPINTFDAGTWNETAYNVDIISNSTISEFQLSIMDKLISFNVKGSDYTSGFSRITIPNIIVQTFWQGNYTVLLNGEPWPFRNWTDATNTYIYVNYTHSEHEITVIPEIPSAIVLPLFMVLCLIVVVLEKRRPSKKSKTSSKTPIF